MMSNFFIKDLLLSSTYKYFVVIKGNGLKYAINAYFIISYINESDCSNIHAIYPCNIDEYITYKLPFICK